MNRSFSAADREAAAAVFEAVVLYRSQHPELSFWMAFGHVPRPSDSATELAGMAVHALLPGATIDDDQTEYLGKVSAALRTGWTPDPAQNTWTPPSSKEWS